MDNEMTFWVVWCPNRGMPTFRHPSEPAAEREARRLAEQNPGCDFYVMQAVARLRRAEPVDCIRLMEPIPF